MASDTDLPEWLERVRNTLTALGMMDDDVRDEIVRQVEEALDDPDHEADLTTPSITVIKGGRTQEPTTPDPEPPRDLTTPRLHLLDEDAPDDDAKVRVKVLRAPELSLGGRPASLEDGHLRLPGGAEALWQIFVHGETPAAYRVHCDRGELLVSSDADVVLRVPEGQSVDLTGVELRARAAGEATAAGRYRRLTGDA